MIFMGLVVLEAAYLWILNIDTLDRVDLSDGSDLLSMSLTV